MGVEAGLRIVRVVIPCCLQTDLLCACDIQADKLTIVIAHLHRACIDQFFILIYLKDGFSALLSCVGVNADVGLKTCVALSGYIVHNL